MSKKVLLIIDMLNDFVDAKGALYCGRGVAPVVAFIQKRLKAYREAGDAVIYLQDAHDEDDKEFERFAKHCVNGTWGSQIIDALVPRAGEKVIPKSRLSGFYGTDLAATLKKSRVEQVEVVGVCTSICVMDTVGELVNRDYRVTVPIKGVADFDQQAHEFALKRIKSVYGADVV